MNKRSFVKNAIALTAGFRLGLTAKAEEPAFTYPLPEKKGPAQLSDFVKNDIIGIYNESTRRMSEEWLVVDVLIAVNDGEKHVMLEKIVTPDLSTTASAYETKRITMDKAKVNYVKVCSSI